MPLADFIHLRVHTAYSLSAGAIKIKELVGLCKAYKHAGGGDDRYRQSVRRARICHACARGGVQPIIGCEVALLTHDGG